MKKFLLSLLLSMSLVAPANAISLSTCAIGNPGADRLLFWDESADDCAALAPSTGLTLSGTSLTVTLSPFSTTNLSEGTNLYYTTERAQDDIGAMATDGTLVYVDATPLFTRGALTGDITAAQGSNTTAIAAGVIVNADINGSAAIDATKIADGSVTSAEFQFIGALTSDAQTQIDGKQPLDSDLTALAGNSTNGLWARTGAGTGATRTLTAPAAGFTITDGDGVVGNPTFVLSNDLAALEGLGSTGFATRTTTNTWAQRVIQGTTNRTSITNGTGIAGDPVVDIAATYVGQSSITTLGTITTGVWNGTTIAVANGGTGQTTYTNGQLLIGNTTGNTLTKATLTAPAAGISITNGTGSITFGLANDLSALEGLASTGIPVRTATDTWVQRSLTAPAAGFTITNNDGVAGNPTFALANDLGALEGLGSTGIAVRTAADTWAQRTITGTASRLSVTNGNGVSGNPTLDIDSGYVGQSSITTLGTITSGTWNATAIAATSGGTGQTTYALGDTLYSSATNTLAKLAGNTSTTKQFLTQTGNGTISAAPVWGTIAAADVGAGFVKVDGSTPMTANWDIGSFELRAETLQSDVATGTAPLIVASTTKVSNLNADLLDDKDTGTSGNVIPLLDGANTWSANQTFSDNIKILLGSIGELYSDATNTILDPVSGQISIGPTGTTTSAGGSSQTGGTEDILIDRIGLGGSPINTFYWINYDLDTTSGRGALNFTQKYTGGGGIQVATNLDARYFGTATNVTNLSLLAKTVIGANNSGTSTSGVRAQIDIDSSLAFTQGTHNIYGYDIITTAVGGTHTGGTIRRIGLNIAPFSALTCSGATCLDLGFNIGNDSQFYSDKKLGLEGAQTTKGDSYLVYNSSTTDIDIFVDGTKSMTVDADKVKQNVCPSGFTRFGLGCIQTAEEGSAAWDTASEDCFDTYGGRLPTPDELMLAVNNLTLTNETDDTEWTNLPFTVGQCAIQELATGATADEFNFQACSTSTAYRCFIPFSGGS